MIKGKDILPIPMVIRSLERLHFRTTTLPDGHYWIMDSDGTNLFGCEVTIMALRRFEDVASRYRRRNGLKKLREQLPEMIEKIKNNPWFWQSK